MGCRGHRDSAAPAIGFFLYGASALIAQLLCLQELLIVFAGHELFLGFSLAAWMGWVGVGSWRVRTAPSNRLDGALLWLIPLLLLNLIAIRLSKCLFGFGMLVGLLPMLLLTGVLLAPIGLVVGRLFGLGCEWCAVRYGFSLGRAYLWDTLGTACGGFLYTWLLAGRLSPEWVVVLLALPAALLAGVLTRRRGRAVLVTIGLSLAFAVSPLPRLTRQLQWHGYRLITERQSRYSHVALAGTGGLISLFENGLISAHFPDPTAYEELVHWPLLVHPAPHRVLIIGTAATGSLAEILKHPIAQVDYVELDPMVIQMLRPALPISDRRALDDPRVRLVHRDGRRVLAATAERYDVILLQLPEPLNAQINRLYTLEAFRTIRSRLAPAGLFAFTIPSSENYLSPATTYFNASLYRTLQAAFPTVELIAGNPLLMLAGTQPVRLDPQQLARRVHERRLVTRDVVPSYFPIKLDAQRREALLSRLTAVPLSLLNRDFAPACYVYAWRVWLSKFLSPLYFLGLLSLIVVAAILLQALWRRRAALAQQPGPLALCALGFSGMVYETILLLAFQAINGYIYWQLGSLFAAFMLGLSLGSWLAVRAFGAIDAVHAARWLRGLLLIIACEGLLLMWLLPVFQRASMPVPWLLPFGLLFAITGVWLGLAFPLANRLSAPPSPRSTGGTLYAADLWGASVGAVLTSALLVPLIGLIPTVGLTGLISFVAAWTLPRSSP